MDVWVDGWINGRTDAWIIGWMDRIGGGCTDQSMGMVLTELVAYLVLGGEGG